MKKLLLVPLLLASLQAFSQYDQLIGKDVPLKERFYVGGGFGLSFTSTSSFVAVSPNIGYRITERGSVGIGVMYQYARQKYDIPSQNIFGQNFEFNHYGGSVFTRYKVYGPIFVAAEYEYVNFETLDLTSPTFETRRSDYSSVLAGGGLAQPITRNVVFVISAMYNLTYSDGNSGPYTTPWNVRVGIAAGF